MLILAYNIEIYVMAKSNNVILNHKQLSLLNIINLNNSLTPNESINSINQKMLFGIKNTSKASSTAKITIYEIIKTIFTILHFVILLIRSIIDTMF